MNTAILAALQMSKRLRTMTPTRLVLGLSCALAAAPLGAQEAVKPAPLPPGVYREMGVSRFLNIGRVLAVSFSPDGRTLAASCWDGTVWVGDVAGGKVLQQWEGSRNTNPAHAFSPDGKVLAAVSGRQVVRLWDVTTGKSLRELKGHSGRLQWVGFSGDGRLLGSQCTQSLRLWKVGSYEEVRRVDKSFASCAPALAFDANLLAYAPNRDSLLVVDAGSGKEIRKIEVPLPYGGAVAFSVDAKYLIFRPEYGQVRWWQLADGRELPPLSAEGLYRAQVALAPNGRIMALAHGNSIELIEIASRRVRLRLKKLEIPGASLAFSPDGRTLAIGGIDRTVLLWDVTGRRDQGVLAPLALSAEELPKLWKDLHGDDGLRAHQAIWKLVAGAKDSVPFLGQQLAPTRSADPQLTARLVRELEAPQLLLRKRAFDELSKLGDAVEDALQARLKEPITLETRRRIEQLSERSEALWSSQWQLGRALEVLEAIGTPAAKELLIRLAAGAPAARMTQQAQASLRRLERRERLK